MAHVAVVLGGRRLRVVDLGHGHVALRGDDGRFVAVRPDTALGFGLCPEDQLTPAAAFEEILWPDGRVSLRSCHLTYVSVHPTSGRVTANRTHPGSHERFVLVTAPGPAVPAQGRSSPAAVSSVSR